VIFDTFVNTEPGHVHKDVSLVWNDGSEAKRSPHGGSTDANVMGCDGDFRFHEGRDDFNPAKDRSAARVYFNMDSSTVSVDIDARNSGEWVRCISEAKLNIGGDWSKIAHLGLTATTGQLADNHDMISLQLSLGDTVTADKSGGGDAPAMISTGQPRFDVAARTAAQSEVAKLKQEMLDMHHELEHHMDKIYDGLQNAVKKLEESERKVEDRVAEIERRLQERIAAHVQDKLEDVVRSKVDDRVDAKVGQAVSRSVNDAVESARRGVESSLLTARELGERMQSQLDDIKSFASSTSAGWPWWQWLVVVLGVLAVGVGIFFAFQACGSGKVRHRSGGGLPSFGVGGGGSKDHFL
jgi:lectin, mannose-binding 2